MDDEDDDDLKNLPNKGKQRSSDEDKSNIIVDDEYNSDDEERDNIGEMDKNETLASKLLNRETCV